MLFFSAGLLHNRIDMFINYYICDMQIILTQIAMLALMASVGAVAFLAKLIKEDTANGMVKLVTKITLPLLIFTTFAGNETNPEILKNSAIVIALSMGSVVLFFAMAGVSARILRLSRDNTALHRVSAMFGNVVFLGFPIINALYPGGEGLIYATMFHLGQNALIWTWGVFILYSSRNRQGGKAWKNLLNPVTMAFAAGITFMFLPVTIPDIILSPLSHIGKTTTYISMVYVGAVLAMVNPLRVFTNIRSYLVSFNKLLLVPAILLLLLKYAGLAGLLHMNSTAVGVVVLLAGMPCMILISVLVRDLDLDYKQSVGNIFLSTVLSFATISFLFWLL